MISADHDAKSVNGIEEGESVVLRFVPEEFPCRSQIQSLDLVIRLPDCDGETKVIVRFQAANEELIEVSRAHVRGQSGASRRLFEPRGMVCADPNRNR